MHTVVTKLQIGNNCFIPLVVIDSKNRVEGM